MADSDKTLNILIELGVIGQNDVKAANDLLAQTKQSSGGAAGAVGDLGSAEKGAAGDADKLHISHRGLHQVLNMLGRETVPQFGHALAGLALYGFVGVIIALGSAFEFAKKKMEEASQALDKIAEAAAKPISERLAAQAEAADRARDAHAGLAAELDAASRAQSGMARQLEDDISTIDKWLARQKKLLEAKKALALENAQTPEERRAIEIGFAGAEGALEGNAAKAKVEAIQSELQKAKDEQGRLKKAADDAAAVAQKADAEKLARQKELENSNRALGDTAEGSIQDRINKAIAEKEAVDKSVLLEKGSPNYNAAMKAAQDKLDAAQNEQSQQRAIADKAIAALSGLADAAAVASERAKSNAAAQVENQKFITEYDGPGGKAAKAARDAADDDRARRQVEFIRRGPGAIDSDMEAATRAIQSGKSNSDAAIRQLAADAQATGQNGDLIVQMLRISLAAHQKTNGEVQWLHKAYSDLNSRVGSMRVQ